MSWQYMPTFFFNDTATTEIYTLSLHDALPILPARLEGERHHGPPHPGGYGRGLLSPCQDRGRGWGGRRNDLRGNRKSTPLNSSNANISYSGFSLKNKTFSYMPISIGKSRRSEE